MRKRTKEYEDLIKEYPPFFVTEEDMPIRILTEEKDRHYVEELTGKETGILYEDEYIYLLRDAVRFPGGKYGTYIRLFYKTFCGGTILFPVTADGKIVLLRHFRHATRSYHYEIPRGMQEKNLTPEENVKKELDEEIGVQGGELRKLGETYPDSGLLGHKTVFYYVKLEGNIFRTKDQEEGIDDILCLSPEEMEQWILEGKIRDGFTIQAFCLAKIRGLL